ncbi:hypothetical protein B1R94_25760 [Mycolicibacterium litorale]|nr:hypothetical protein B1R94_25760 [Mycolicibacterium litorale]
MAAAAASPCSVGRDFTREVMPLTGELYRRAYSYTRNTADAEDLLQDTLFRAYRAFHALREGSHIRAWLLRIMQNVWISRYRATLCRPAETLVGQWTDGHVDDGYGPALAQAGSAESVALLDVVDPEILRALSALPEALRLTVFYVAVRGMTCREVAAFMGVPEGTVLSRLHRGRRQLRTALGDPARWRR